MNTKILNQWLDMVTFMTLTFFFSIRPSFSVCISAAPLLSFSRLLVIVMVSSSSSKQSQKWLRYEKVSVEPIFTFQSQQNIYHNNVWNRLKYNNKDTRTTPVTALCCLIANFVQISHIFLVFHCWLWTSNNCPLDFFKKYQTSIVRFFCKYITLYASFTKIHVSFNSYLQ